MSGLENVIKGYGLGEIRVEVIIESLSSAKHKIVFAIEIPSIAYFNVRIRFAEEVQILQVSAG